MAPTTLKPITLGKYYMYTININIIILDLEQHCIFSQCRLYLLYRIPDTGCFSKECSVAGVVSFAVAQAAISSTVLLDLRLIIIFVEANGLQR